MCLRAREKVVVSKSPQVITPIHDTPSGQRVVRRSGQTQWDFVINHRPLKPQPTTHRPRPLCSSSCTCRPWSDIVGGSQVGNAADILVGHRVGCQSPGQADFQDTHEKARRR